MKINLTVGYKTKSPRIYTIVFSRDTIERPYPTVPRVNDWISLGDDDSSWDAQIYEVVFDNDGSVHLGITYESLSNHDIKSLAEIGFKTHTPVEDMVEVGIDSEIAGMVYEKYVL